MKKGNTVRYTLDEALEYRRKRISGVDWEKVNAMTPEDIERLADEDDKRLGIDPDEWGEPYRVNGIDDVLAYMNRTDGRSGSSDSDSEK